MSQIMLRNKPQPGELWVTRDGHLATIVSITRESMPVEGYITLFGGVRRHTTWSLKGSYHPTVPNHALDLMRKLPNVRVTAAGTKLQLT
jgi:hypothetical protein